MKAAVENMAGMTPARQVGYGIGGFTLSMATVLLMAASLQLILNLVWAPPQSLLVAFTTPLVVLTTALAGSWACLLKGLRNRAMIRGVWCQIYAVVGAAIVGLLIVLFL